jgi:hypothetical protein
MFIFAVRVVDEVGVGVLEGYLGDSAHLQHKLLP